MFIGDAREDLVVDVGVLVSSCHPQVFVCCIFDWIIDVFHLYTKIRLTFLVQKQSTNTVREQSKNK